MIHTERIDIIVQEHGSRVVKRELHDLGEVAQRGNNRLMYWIDVLKENLGLLALVATGAGVALSGLGFALFEQKLNAAGIAAGASAGQLQMLSDKAREVSLQYGTMAIETATGMEEMAKAGVTSQQMLDGALEQALIMAKATGAEFEDGAGVAANAMKVFGFQANELNKVVQGGSAVINLTTHDLNDYRLAIANAGFMAKAQGVTFDDFNAVLAATAAGFSGGATQGTSLKTFLLRLSPTTREASSAMERLGLNFREANGSLMSMDKVADHLRARLGGLSEAQKSQALQTVFGIDAYQIAVNLMEAGGETVRRYRDEIIPMTDAEKQAEVRTKGLAGAFMVLLASLVDFSIEVMDGEWGVALGNIMRGLGAAVVWLGKNLDALEPIIMAVGAGLAVTFGGKLVGWLFTVNNGMGLIKGSMMALNALALSNPLAMVAAGATALGFALYRARDAVVVTRDGMVTMGDFGQAVMQSISEGAVQMANNVVNVFSEMSDQSAVQFESIGQIAATVWMNTLDGLRYVFNQMNGAFIGFFAFQVTYITRWKDILAGKWEEVGQAAGQAYNNAFKDYAGAIVDPLMEQARRNAQARLARNRPEIEVPEWKPGPKVGPDADAARNFDPNQGGTSSRAEMLSKINRELDQNTRILGLNNREREIQAEIFRTNEQLIGAEYARLTENETKALEDKLRLLQRETELTGVKDQYVQQLVEAQRPLLLQQEALNQLMRDGVITQQQFSTEMRKTAQQMLQMKIDMGQGTFVDGFLNGLAKMLEGTEQFASNAGATFMGFYQQMSDGFADSVGRAIAFGDDLGASLMNVARSAVGSLISAFVKLGIQWAVNAVLGQSLQAAMTAASVSQAAVVAQAWAAAATAVSLASFGANSAPAIAGMATAYSFGAGLAAFGMADGGMVRGPGGPRSDMVPRMLSNGEFVVNAAATRSNIGLLNAINSGSRVVSGGGISINAPTSITVNSDNAEDGAEAGRRAAQEFERGFVALVKKHKRPGGALAGR